MSHPLPHQFRVHAGISELPRQAWNALVPPEAVPFLEWEWLNALEESGSICASAGWRPSHFTLWEGPRLVAAAPAYLKSDSDGEFVFDWTWATAAERAGIAYYPKLILAVPLTPATGQRLLVAPGEDRELRMSQLLAAILEFARSQSLSSVHVLFPTEAEADALERLGFATRLGVQYQWHNRGYRSWEDLLGHFRSKRRNQILREKRAPAQQGITIRTRRGEELTQADAEIAWRLHCATLDKYPYGQRVLNRAFFEQLLRTMPGRVELVEALREGRLVAGALNLAGPQTLYGRYWGCFEEHPFLHFNVGIYHSVEESIARGVRRFEPGAGGEHKLVRGFEPTLTYSSHWLFHPRLDAAVRGFLANERAAIRQGLPRWREETGFRRDGRSLGE